MTQEQAEQDKLQQESEVQRQRLKEVVVEVTRRLPFASTESLRGMAAFVLVCDWHR